MSKERKHVSWSADEKTTGSGSERSRSPINWRPSNGCNAHIEGRHEPSNNPKNSNCIRRDGHQELNNQTWKTVNPTMKIPTRLSLPYRHVVNPEFRQPLYRETSNSFRPWPSYVGYGYPAVNNNYNGNSSYDYYRSRDPVLASVNVPNQRAQFNQTRRFNPYNRGNANIALTKSYSGNLKSAVANVLNYVKTISGDQRSLHSQVSTPSDNQLFNMYSRRNYASTAPDNNPKYASAEKTIQKFVQNVSDGKSWFHSEVLLPPKTQKEPTFQSVCGQSAQQDRNMPESDHSREQDDDLIFLGIVDKNDLKKDVEVITISDDDAEENEDGVNEDKNQVQGECVKVKLESGSSWTGEVYRTWPAFREIDPSRQVIFKSEPKNFPNFHFNFLN